MRQKEKEGRPQNVPKKKECSFRGPQSAGGNSRRFFQSPLPVGVWFAISPGSHRGGSIPEKPLTSEEKSGKIQSSSKPSATGANKFEKGFSQQNLDRHWVGGESDHSAEYPGWTKEEYAQRAMDLVQKSVDGVNILGYKTSKDQIARYDCKTNDYVKGRPSQGIATMFKPTDGIAYFFRRMKKENGTDKD